MGGEKQQKEQRKRKRKRARVEGLQEKKQRWQATTC
jgi:hypothetical protein